MLSKIYHDFYAFKDKFSYLFSEVFSAKHVKIYLFLTAGLNACLWFLCWLFYRQVKEDLIILHYNIDFGVDLIGQPGKIFIIPFFGLFTLVFNFILLFIFARRIDFKMISHLSLAAALLVNLFLSLSFGPLYIINFN
jgi:hypothetical protein